MSQGNARAFAKRLGTDNTFRQQLFAHWTGVRAPTLTDITEAGNRFGYTFSLEELRLELKHNSQFRENIASLHPQFRFEERPTEYDDGPEVYPNTYSEDQ